MDIQSQRLSLSVEEIALAFSLINHADVGKSLLQNAYGDLSSSSTEDKLTAASHSLFARGFAKISAKGVAMLDESVELALYPLIKFRNVIQVTLSSLDGSGPDITNVYLGANEIFTALRVSVGVVYELSHAAANSIPATVHEILHLPRQLISFNNPGNAEISVNMASIASLIGGGEKNPAPLLKQAGIPESISVALGKDMTAPRGRASIVLTGINFQNYLKKNRNEAGAGLLLLWGDFAWMFKFEDANDQTVAQLLPFTHESLLLEISNLVGR